MTAQSDPYVRVYYRIIEDPKFAAVYDDDRALATWLRLLLYADAMFPAPAILPLRCNSKALKTLVDAELIDLLPGDRYRIHGLTAEREQRSEHGRKAALARHGQSTSNARAMHEQSASSAQPMHSEPNRTEPIRTSPIQSEPSRSTPTPAGAEKNGSKNRETDEERLARYRLLAIDTTQPAYVRETANAEVARLEALRLN